ncbi:MAG: hypothetical protein JNL19_06270 [Burkholderiales bacterium]|nr:hypothetical protein [Burkholderiales bacterium]
MNCLTRGLAAVIGLVVTGLSHGAITAGISTSDTTPDVGGAAFTWTITLTNGASTSTNVQMTFPLPTGAKYANHSISGTAGGAYSCVSPSLGVQGTVVCEAASVAANAIATIAVVAQYDSEMSAGVRTATVRVVSGGIESTASVGQTLQSSPLVSLTLSATSSVAAGGIVNVRAMVVTSGSAASINPLLQIALPAGLSFLGVFGSKDFHGVCSLTIASNTVECSPRFLTGTNYVTVVARSSYDLPAGVISTTGSLLVVAPSTTSGSPATANTTITN